jgi:hypothetical protein
MCAWLVDIHQQLWAFNDVLGSHSMVRPVRRLNWHNVLNCTFDIYMYSEALIGAFCKSFAKVATLDL